MPDAGWPKDCRNSMERARMLLRNIREPVKKITKAESRKKVDLIPWAVRWAAVPWDLKPPQGFKCLNEKYSDQPEGPVQ